MIHQTLYMNQIIFPDMNTLISARRSQYMYLKGIKLNLVINNDWNKPARVHMAIVQDRDNNNSDLDRTQNFFRDTTSQTSRAHPFNSWVSGAGYDYRQRIDPICSDHYHVITHTQFIIDGKTQTQPRTVKSNVKQMKKFYRINRRVAFDNLVDTTNWRPFYICLWWNENDDSDYLATDGASRLYYRYKTEVVFNNIL